MMECKSVPASIDVVEEAAKYLNTSESSDFRKECENAGFEAFSLIRERYFSKQTTSLMGPDLEKLEKVSQDPELRSLVKTIIIQDECEQNDPWNYVCPFRTNVIWPEDEHGNILSKQIGVRNLRDMLSDGRLLPDIIIIRDYRINRSNLYYCPENDNRQAYRQVDYGRRGSAAALLARDIIEGPNLRVIAVNMQLLSETRRDHSYFENPNAPLGMSLGSPLIAEVTISLSPSSNTQECEAGLFSMLRSAEVLAAPYWIEKMLYHAPLLENLTISPSSPWDDVITSRVVPIHLKQLAVGNSTVHANTIHAVMSGSLHTLRSISFQQVTLKTGSDWGELSSSFQNFKHLTSFHIKFLWQEGPRKLPVDFVEFSKTDVAEKYLPGLECKVRGTADDPRISWIKYEGPDAGEVLACLGLHAKLRLPYTAEYLARHRLLTAERNSDV